MIQDFLNAYLPVPKEKVLKCLTLTISFEIRSVSNLFSHHFYVLHYGPWEGSKDGTSKVLTYLHDLPDYTWQEPDQDDPLSLVDQVRKAMP